MHRHIQLEGELFEAVQMGGIFPDSKTFVDSTPRSGPGEIMERYRKEKDGPGFDLLSFVKENFSLPAEKDEKSCPPRGISMEEHISLLWEHLSREPDREEGGTLIPLKHPYVVPGGRFREIYYWDSYFTAEGLAACGRMDMVEGMARNFAHLIDTLGHVPNGNRVYYASRSQPPFFCSMVDIIARARGVEEVFPCLPRLEREYEFWMAGREELAGEGQAIRRVVMMPGGDVLNRYWDGKNTPREESYREDVETLEMVEPGRRGDFYRHLRAACESGWDFSSRWLGDGENLASIRTLDVIPLDLNCILLEMETRLGEWFLRKGDIDRAGRYAGAGDRRREAIQKYFWDEDEGYFFDCTRDGRTGVWSLAGAYPLFFGAARQEQADRAAAHLREKFLRPGGLVTTLRQTGQQWDSPNGWAPLQWIGAMGLLRYGHGDLAREVARRFVALARDVFARTGKMMEKYNVCEAGLPGGGGEYPLQDGFGWTNGTVMAMLTKFKDL
jgi:alpha,alpha-trehalase